MMNDLRIPPVLLFPGTEVSLQRVLKHLQRVLKHCKGQEPVNICRRGQKKLETTLLCM